MKRNYVVCGSSAKKDFDGKKRVKTLNSNGCLFMPKLEYAIVQEPKVAVCSTLPSKVCT